MPRTTDHALADTITAFTEKLEVDGLEDLVEGLEERMHQPRCAIATVDVVAHARGGVLELGTWDTEDARSAARFARAAAAALTRLRVTAIRLLGCGTAATPRGRATLRRLQAEIRAAGLAVRVVGTTIPVWATDFDPTGLRPRFAGLVDADNL